MKIQGLHYNNIGLISRHISNLESRNLVDTSHKFAGEKLTLPLIASPMPDVCDGHMSNKLKALGGYGFIHRFCTIEQQIFEYNIPKCGGCAIGINGDSFERFQALHNMGCNSFCIDVANGSNEVVGKFINRLFKYNNNILITVGNVASKECYKWLCNFPIYAIRVGIAGGAACTTKTETGIFYPMASSIIECESVRDSDGPLLIADGSIKEPQDLCKAIVLGADICMAGSIFASTEDSPGKTMRINGKLLKVFRGAASFSTQKMVNKKPDYVEGMENLIPYTGPVEKLMKRFTNGLKSSMSYMNAKNLEEYRNHSDWCVI